MHLAGGKRQIIDLSVPGRPKIVDARILVAAHDRSCKEQSHGQALTSGNLWVKGLKQVLRQSARDGIASVEYVGIVTAFPDVDGAGFEQ